MQVNAASNYNSATPVTTSTQGAGLGKDDFLKLLVGQLRNQNPMDPSGSEDFIQQMTMFSTLEQVTNLAAAGERITGALGETQALGLIGRTVTYTKADGTSAQGVVEQVMFAEGGVPRLTIGGEAGIDPAAVMEVR